MRRYQRSSYHLGFRTNGATLHYIQTNLGNPNGIQAQKGRLQSHIHRLQNNIRKLRKEYKRLSQIRSQIASSSRGLTSSQKVHVRSLDSELRSVTLKIDKCNSLGRRDFDRLAALRAKGNEPPMESPFAG